MRVSRVSQISSLCARSFLAFSTWRRRVKVVFFCEQENLIILSHFLESFHIPCSNTYDCVGFKKEPGQEC